MFCMMKRATSDLVSTSVHCYLFIYIYHDIYGTWYIYLPPCILYVIVAELLGAPGDNWRGDDDTELITHVKSEAINLQVSHPYDRTMKGHTSPVICRGVRTRDVFMLSSHNNKEKSFFMSSELSIHSFTLIHYLIDYISFRNWKYITSGVFGDTLFWNVYVWEKHSALALQV